MPDISHMLDIHATPDVVFEIISTADGIRQWWSTSVTEVHPPDGEIPGGEIIVRFGEKWKLMLQKINETRDLSVAFRVTQHDSDEWIGTELHFALEANEDWTTLRFDQRAWLDKTDFFRFCSAKWVVFLLSIKLAAETGKGAPYPNETKTGRHD